MSSCELQCLLWSNQGKSDKIWGYVSAGDNLYSFWGRRSVVDKDGFTSSGKRPSLQFKYHTISDIGKLTSLRESKENKGYDPVDINDVDNYVQGFTEFFESALILARLNGKVRNDFK